jgi:hypothetical protein
MNKRLKISEPSTDEGFLPEIMHSFPTLSREDAVMAWGIAADRITLAIQGPYARTAACSILNSPEGRHIAKRVFWPQDIGGQAVESFLNGIVGNFRFASSINHHIKMAERIT